MDVIRKEVRYFCDDFPNQRVNILYIGFMNIFKGDEIFQYGFKTVCLRPLGLPKLALLLYDF